MAQRFEWAKNFGNSLEETGRSIVHDEKGNSYSTGYFSGTVDFDPGSGTYNLTSSGNEDAFISKLDLNGNFVWAKKISGVNEVLITSITLDKSGNITVLGNFSGTADFNSGSGTYSMTSLGSLDIFICQLDTSGNFNWAKSIGSKFLDDGRNITSDVYGNIYVTGYFKDSVDFDPDTNIYTLISAAVDDIFILKLDSLGSFQWAKQIEGTSVGQGFSIVTDDSSNVYTTGTFYGTCDFDPSANSYNLRSSGNADAFILKLDSSGNFVWAIKFGGNDIDQSHSIALDSSNNIYACGNFKDTVDFDPGNGTFYMNAQTNADVFILKLNSNGGFEWAKKITGPDNIMAYEIKLDNLGNIYAVGNFRGTVDFDPDTSIVQITSWNYDAFLLKLDSAGNYLWAISFGGQHYQRTSSLSIDKSYNIYTMGWFAGTVDFDPDPNNNYNLTYNGYTDIFVLKLSQCSNSSSIEVFESCESFISPSGKYEWTSSGSYRDTLQNASGCDSIMIIGLKIYNHTSNVMIKTACDSLISPSKKFTWYKSGNYTDTLQNSKGCDSTIIIGLTINNSHEDTIKEFSCDTYISPSGKYIWNTSGFYKDTLSSSTGCDSILFIDLTVHTVDTSVSITGNMSLKANALGAIYQWVDCNNSFAAISGKTHQSYTASKIGSYAVIVSQNNCTDTSSCYQLINTGIIGYRESAIFNYYPNPTNGKLFIESQTDSYIKILNTSGQLVFKDEIKNKQKVINLQLLSNGLYYIQFENKHRIFSGKLLISK